MKKRASSGKSSEFFIISELIKRGLDVYMPCLDDKGIDLIIRTEREERINFYEIQVKSVKDYGTITGVRNPKSYKDNFYFIIHFKFSNEQREERIIYLTREQAINYWRDNGNWKDLLLKKGDIEKYKDQNLDKLVKELYDKLDISH